MTSLGCHKPAIPVVTFLTSSVEFRQAEGSICHAFAVYANSESQNQISFYPVLDFSKDT